MAKEKSCGVVLFRKSKETGIKFLVLHYIPGHWDFPKGHQEKNERDWQTAERELKEETGISETQIVDGFLEKTNYYFKRENETVFKEVVYFLAETTVRDITLSTEHVGYAWLGYENAMKKLTFKSSQDILGKAKIYLEKR
ncbi:MAG TPA: NUDIX domain-containing protein [Candidatus Nanoarchaeia archaeon]|nr:NUDIX domain-containing protein [Candidatus Nanoarchaeia archaeon]